MEATTYNFKNHMRGDSFNGAQFELTQDFVPVDLTGASLRCQFRKGSEDGAVIIDITDTNGITVDDAANGIFSLDAIDAPGFPAGTLYYDIQITFQSGVVKTYIRGTLKVLKDTTK